MKTATYYYTVKNKLMFDLTQNGKKLQSPYDLQFFIEILMDIYQLHIQVLPCAAPSTIKVIFEKDDRYHYCAMESIFRKYIKDYY